MPITITNVADKAVVHNIFEELYASSLPHMSSKENPFGIEPNRLGLTAKEQFKNVIFKDIDKEKEVAGTILVKIDGYPLNLLSYTIEKDGLMRAGYALYNDYENSRSWMYGDLMREYSAKEIEYFIGLGAIGYCLEVNKTSPMYAYHKSNRPDLEKYFTITEEPFQESNNVVTITLRLKQENPFN